MFYAEPEISNASCYHLHPVFYALNQVLEAFYAHANYMMDPYGFAGSTPATMLMRIRCLNNLIVTFVVLILKMPRGGTGLASPLD